MSDEQVLVGYSGEKTPVQGSTRLKCSACGTPVWISPSAYRLYVAGLRVICERCVPPGAEVGITEETLKEIATAVHGHRNRN
jgi:hypothetical protein